MSSRLLGFGPGGYPSHAYFPPPSKNKYIVKPLLTLIRFRVSGVPISRTPLLMTKKNASRYWLLKELLETFSHIFCQNVSNVLRRFLENFARCCTIFLLSYKFEISKLTKLRWILQNGAKVLNKHRHLEYCRDSLVALRIRWKFSLVTTYLILVVFLLERWEPRETGAPRYY